MKVLNISFAESGLNAITNRITLLCILHYYLYLRMEKKESYRHILPHFQQPGQTYFVTWNLHDAIPVKALARYTSELEMLKSQIKFLEQQNPVPSEIEKIKQE
jgi:hypothetical protein